MSSTEPGVVLQVQKVPSVLEAGKCSGELGLPLPFILFPGRGLMRQGKNLGEGHGPKGTAGSCFSGSPLSAWAIPACFEYNTLFTPSLFAQTGLISLLDCIFMEDMCPNPLIFQR